MTTEAQQLYNYLAPKHGLDWIQAFGVGKGTANDCIVFWLLGQSNSVGHGLSGYTIGDVNSWVIGRDGLMRTATEPIYAGAFPVPTNTGGQGPGDLWGQFAIQLRADPSMSGKTIIFVPCAVNGSTSAQWNNELANNPPDINSLYGNSVLKLRYAMQAKNAKCGGVFVYQGESNCDTLAHATTGYNSDWDAVTAAALAELSGKMLKTTTVWHIRPPATVPSGTDATNWAAMRSTITGRASSTTHVVDALDGLFIDGTNLHLDTGTASPPAGLRGTGLNLATDWLAAS